MKILLIAKTLHSFIQVKHLLDVNDLEQKNLHCNDVDKFKNMAVELIGKHSDMRDHYFMTLFIIDLDTEFLDEMINANCNVNVIYKDTNKIIISGSIRQFEQLGLTLKKYDFGKAIMTYLKANFNSYKDTGI